jgi:hypothetical protein
MEEAVLIMADPCMVVIIDLGIDTMAATPGAIVVDPMAVDIMVDKTMVAGIGDSWVKDYNVR